MAYEPSRGKHQASVLHRMLRHEGKFPTKRVAELAGVSADSLDDWAANRAPVPAWALPRLCRAFEQLIAGAGVVFLREVLLGVVDVRSAARVDVDATEAARRVQDTGAEFEKALLACLTDERSPGRLDEHEVRELAPMQRAHLAAVTAYDAASRSIPERQLSLAQGAM